MLVELLPRLAADAWRLAPVAIARFGRVALEDEIGQVFDAPLALMLIGERPGLGSPDSLGAYMVFEPRIGNTDANRNCVSNIRPEGLPPAAAADAIHFLLTDVHPFADGNGRISRLMMTKELLDAAAMDGASPMRTLWSIVLPISRPILGVVSIFAVVGVWKDFLWPMLTLPDPAKQTLNVGIYSLSSGVPVNVLIAALTIASVPTLLIFLIFQRNIMSGLTAGGLKG